MAFAGTNGDLDFAAPGKSGLFRFENRSR